MEDNLESLIQEFQKSYKYLSGHFKSLNWKDLSSDEKKSQIGKSDLYSLAKQIVERLSPEVLASKDDRFHTFGHQLTTVFKYVQDKDGLLKIAKTYEQLGEYYYAGDIYLLSSDRESIVGFISRSIRNPKSIYVGVSTLKKLKNRPPGLVEMSFFKAFNFGKYDLAIDIAYLKKDKWKEEEILGAVGLPQNSTVL